MQSSASMTAQKKVQQVLNPASVQEVVSASAGGGAAAASYSGIPEAIERLTQALNGEEEGFEKAKQDFFAFCNALREPEKKEAYNQLFNEGEKFKGSRQYELELKIYSVMKEVTQLNPKVSFAPPHTLANAMGYAFHNSGDLSKAQECFEEAYSLAPSADLESKFHLRKALGESNNIEAERGLGLEKSTKAIYHFKGAIKLSRQLPAQEKAWCGDGIKKCYLGLGKAYISTKDYKEAIKALEVAKGSDTDYAVAFYIGSCQISLGNFDEAISMLEKSIESGKRDIGKSYPGLLASLYVKRGEAYVKKVEAQFGEGKLVKKAAQVKEGFWAKARDSAKEAIKLDPSVKGVYEVLYNSFSDEKVREDAFKALGIMQYFYCYDLLRTVKNGSQGSGYTSFIYPAYYLSINEKGEIAQTIEGLVGTLGIGDIRDSGLSRAKAMTLFQLGLTALKYEYNTKKGKWFFNEALKFCTNVIEDTPPEEKNVSDYLLRASIEMITGMFKEAEDTFKAAIEVDPRVFDSYLGLIELQWRKGEEGKAFVEISRYITAHPYDDKALLLKSYILVSSIEKEVKEGGKLLAGISYGNFRADLREAEESIRFYRSLPESSKQVGEEVVKRLEKMIKKTKAALDKLEATSAAAAGAAAAATLI